MPGPNDFVDRREFTSSPQVEDGYTRIATELVEALMRTRLLSDQSKILWWVIRNTYGWNRKTAPFSWWRIAKETKSGRYRIWEKGKDLIQRNILKIENLEIGIQKDHEKWLKDRTRTGHVTRLGAYLGAKAYPVHSTYPVPSTKPYPVPSTKPYPVPVQPIIQSKTIDNRQENSAVNGLGREDLVRIFGKLWQEFPKKEAKKKSLEAWLKLKPDKALIGRIQSSLEKQIASGKEERFFPRLDRWIRDRRWEDELPAPAAGEYMP